jgi:hypothetical protein
MEVFTLVTGTTDGESAPDDDGLTLLLRRLELAYRKAGKPAYRQIGRSCGLSASTICRIFNAKKPPPWDNLEGVLRALRVDVDADATWRELWLSAENDAKPITVELVDGLIAPGRRNCPGCGAWIADDDAHERHHQQIDTLTQQVDQLRQQLTHLTATTSGQ